MAKPSISTESLRAWNGWLAALYAVEALIIVIFGVNKMAPIYMSYLTTDTIQSKITGHTVVAPAIHHLWDVRMQLLAASIVVVAALAHVLLATWYRPNYDMQLKDGINKIRWIEYALSGGLLVVFVALVVGMSDAGSVIVLFALTALAALCGYIMETHNPWRRSMQVKWSAAVAGAAAAIVAWLVVGMQALATQLYGNGNLPAYFYALYALVMLAFAGLAAILVARYKQVGKWADYYYSERSYMILGAVTKTLFAGLVLLGVLR